MIYQEFVSEYKSIIKGEIVEINNQDIYTYLNKEFENELINNPNFYIWNIKWKLEKIRISSSSNKNQAWENEVEKILADN